MKNIIFFLQGGIGKHIAATAVAECIKNNYKERNLIVICPYPEVFLNNPFVHRTYRSNTCQYFHEDFIKDKDVIFLGNLTEDKGPHLVNNIYHIDKTKLCWGTHGMLIKNANITKIYNKLLNIFHNIDYQYAQLIKNEELNGFVIMPSICTQVGMESTISIYD